MFSKTELVPFKSFTYLKKYMEEYKKRNSLFFLEKKEKEINA